MEFEAQREPSWVHGETEISCDGGLDNVPLQMDIWREIQRLDP